MNGNGGRWAAFVVVAMLSGCAGSTRKGEYTPPAPVKPNPIQTFKVGDSVEVGRSDGANPSSVPIRFTVASVMELGPGVRVRVTAQSAREGRIAYLYTKIWGGGMWQQLLAVSNQTVSLHLSDDYGNEYRLISIEPSAGSPLHELYPGQTMDVILVFKGPVVSQAKTVTFGMRYWTGDGEHRHEWLKPRR